MKNIKKRRQYWKGKKVGIFLCGWKKWLLIAVGMLSMTKLLYAMDFGGFEVEVGVGSKEDFVFEENSEGANENVIQPEIEVVPGAELMEPEVVEPVESEPKPVESESKPVESEPEPVESESKPVESEPKPVESEPKPVESESKPMEPESKPAELEQTSAESKKQSETVVKELEPEEGEQERKSKEKKELKKADEKEKEQTTEMLWECWKWKKNVGKEKEIILNIDTEGAASILSFRIDGEECEWEWKGKQIFCKRKKASGEGILEILFLYEKGKNFKVYDASVH